MITAALVISVAVLLVVSLTVIYVPRKSETKGRVYVTYPALGENGRLGNQLFQISAVLGVADKHDAIPSIPDWKYSSDLFETPSYASLPPSADIKTPASGEQDAFTFTPLQSNGMERKSHEVSMNGYRQNMKYFKHIIHKIYEYFIIKYDIEQEVNKYTSDPVIGVHIRRGDYVDNPVHQSCTKEYYIQGINAIRAKYPALPVIFITDDKQWVRDNMQVPNSSISPFDTEVHDFALLKQCKHKVISNSTFAWWSSFLSPVYDSLVVAPYPWIKNGEKFQDIYMENWHVIDCSSNTVIQKFPELKQCMGGVYQCYKMPKAFIKSMQSFRRFYPEGSMSLVVDNGYNYAEAAKYFQVNHYFHCEKQSGSGVTTHLTGLDVGVLYIKNFLDCVKDIDEEYFILLEDDTCILRALDTTEFKGYDLIGCNRNNSSMPARAYNYLVRRNKPSSKYIGGCGGSVFKTSFWADLVIDDVINAVNTFYELSEQQLHSDIMFTFLCWYFGGTVMDGPSDQLIESKSEVGNGKANLLHQYKDHYNLTPDNNDLKILGPDFKKIRSSPI